MEAFTFVGPLQVDRASLAASHYLCFHDDRISIPARMPPVVCVTCGEEDSIDSA